MKLFVFLKNVDELLRFKNQSKTPQISTFAKIYFFDN